MADEHLQPPNDLMDSHEAFLRLWTHHEPELQLCAVVLSVD